MLVLDFTCAPGYSKASYCHNESCANGGLDTAGACICQTGFTGLNCETDLCTLPFGTRNPTTKICTCTNSSYTGPYCQLSACANGGTWNTVSRSCACRQAYTGFNCTQSTCGAKGTPNATTGLCNCTQNYHFETGLGCVADPVPVCLNGGTAVNYTCRCPLSHYGPLCETRRCGPNSSLNKTTGVCDCIGLWRPNPLEAFNCTSSVCQPGGEPAPYPSEFCLCLSPYSPVPPTNTRCAIQCNERGTFDPQRRVCLCDNGFGGDNCQTVLPYQTNQTDFTVISGSPVDLTNNVTVPTSATPENITSVVGGNCPV